MEPVILALENKYQDKVKFVVVDVDDPQGQELARQFQVNSIPAFFFIDRDKNIRQQGIGETTQANMEKMMESILP